MVASDVMNEARNVYLNDALASLYTNSLLLPHVNVALEELQQEMERNGNPLFKEISTTITVAALSQVLGLPSDFVKPIKLEERAVGGSVSDWIPMDELDWEPSIQPGETLKYWNYREDGVKLLGATVQREVKLFYWKTVAIVTAAGDTISIINGKRFLAQKVASLAAMFIGHNSMLGEKLGLMAEISMNTLQGNNVRERQGRPVRRRPYKWRRRHQFFIIE